jgi:ANTAR domain-containing protein
VTAYARDALPDRIVIAQAEGILAARRVMPVADAIAILRDDARRSGC